METIVVESLISEYIRIREQTLKICEPLLPEDYVVQPIVDVSPPKWHLAHTTWFFEAFVLKDNYQGYKVFDDAYNFIFNSYYENIGDRLARVNRGNLTRPSVSEIKEYRRYVDVFLIEFLEKNSDEEINKLVQLGLQHEQQHQELLVTDIKYILGNNPLFPEYKKLNIDSGATRNLKYIIIPRDIYSIGCTQEKFCFDNEQPAHEVLLKEFAISNRLITNGEYIHFIESGGYKNFKYWLLEGWELVKAFKWKAPLYWVKKGSEWYEYTLHGLNKINLNSPVAHVSFYEADAFAKWSDKRLPTEFEWEAAVRLLKPDIDHGCFLESGYFHPLAAEENNFQFLGDLWEWTYSAYHPYPGYNAKPGAIGEYNGKFMINQVVLRGGSCATAKDHIRISYRNFFHPDARWQFSGIRLCEND